MKVRHLLVAASAAAFLAGSSYGALAGSHSFSKGESYSSVHSVGTFKHGNPISKTDQRQHNQSIAVNGGGAGAEAGTTGGALAVEISIGYHAGGSGSAAWGSTSGKSCAGSAC